MAKRSDFAQKLLDDLRLRKERVAASQGSKGSKQMAGDGYAYSIQTYKGSRDMTTQQRARAKKSLPTRLGSNDIVPFQRARNSEQIGDLSMALAFALKNGGKFRSTDQYGNSSVLDLLNQISGRSIHSAKMETRKMGMHQTSTTGLPTFSNLHIQEILNAALKLNQILKPCSNGVNFNRYSMEVGKELLKGAIDLEESLRMLAYLLEASQYTVTPQRKSRIRLLDDDDDDGHNNDLETTDQMQLARPRFSFDKSSSNLQYIQRVARLVSLTYQSESSKHSREGHTLQILNSASHWRSNSYSPGDNTTATFLEQRNQSAALKSKPEKGRLPNIIAKLMGLEELPENVESNNTTRKSFSPKPKTEERTSVGSSPNGHKAKKTAGSSEISIKKQSQAQGEHNQVSHDTVNTVQAIKNQASHHAGSEVRFLDRRSLQKDEGVKARKGSDRYKLKVDNKQQINVARLIHSTRNQKDNQHQNPVNDKTPSREHKTKEKAETKGSLLKLKLPQIIPDTKKVTETSFLMLRQTTSNMNIQQKDVGDPKKFSVSKQSHPSTEIGFNEPYVQSFVSQDIKRHAGATEQQNATGRNHVSSEGSMQDTIMAPKVHPYEPESGTKTSPGSFNPMQSMKFLNIKERDLIRDQTSADFRIYRDDATRDLHKSTSLGDMKSELMHEGIKIRSTEAEDHRPSMQKQNAKFQSLQKPEARKKIDEMMARSRSPRNLANQLRTRSSTLKEIELARMSDKVTGHKDAEQVRSSRCKAVKAHIIRTKTSIKNSKQSVDFELDSAVKHECQISEAQEIFDKHVMAPLVAVKCQSSVAVEVNQQGKVPNTGVFEAISDNEFLNPQICGDDRGTDFKYNLQQETRGLSSKLQTPDQALTESENQLKKTLIKSQLFLNTAEALFKLNIPLGIRQAGSHENHLEESKLEFNCCYELMTRKGQMQELSAYPTFRLSLACPSVKSLDDLIKELHIDLRKLRFYGRNEGCECNVEDYLPKIIENDIYKGETDINCLWDLGWNETTFVILEKDEVIRDVERFLLNGLLDELTADLLLVC